MYKLVPLKSLNAKSCWFTGPKKRYLWANYISLVIFFNKILVNEKILHGHSTLVSPLQDAFK